mgnify:CR=1 FL=1
MEQLKSKEYTSIAKLEIAWIPSRKLKLVPYSELPSPQEIVKELKRRRYLENGITAQQLGCAEDGDQSFSFTTPQRSLRKRCSKSYNLPFLKTATLWPAILSFLQTRSQKTHKSRPKKRGLLNWPKQAFPIASRTKKGQKLLLHAAHSSKNWAGFFHRNSKQDSLAPLWFCHGI